jgi:hypothetical protein
MLQDTKTQLAAANTKLESESQARLTEKVSRLMSCNLFSFPLCPRSRSPPFLRWAHWDWFFIFIFILFLFCDFNCLFYFVDSWFADFSFLPTLSRSCS